MFSSHSQRNRFILSTIVGVGIVAVAGVAVVEGLKREESKTTHKSENTVPRPISLIASGDTAGWIVPCGCTSNQSGGLLRRGAIVASEKETSNVILVDVGGAAGGTSPYDQSKLEAILQGEIKMGIAAHNLGGSELKLGSDYLQAIQEKLDIPFVSANVRDSDGDFIVETHRVIDVSGKRLLIVGVVSSLYAVSGLQISSPRDAVLAIADEYVKQYDWLIVLAYMPERELRSFASDLPEADVILGGATHQSIAPASVGPATLAAATNKGKYLVHLQAPFKNDQDRWKGRVVEVNQDFKDDAIQKQNLQQFYSELSKQDFTAAQTGFSPPLPINPPPGYQISGTESCLKCHQDDARHWEHSAHAHAWKTLRRSGAHVDADCQRCHTTGFGLPGGFVSVKRSLNLVNVGCESCHGPSAAHTRNTKIRTPFLAKDQCIYCHDRENSPEFKFEKYWSQIIHGQQDPESNTEPQP
ncbi:multiheme c-type cytochrome [Gimesia algae]|uniref:Perchlorate reductase subunit gamma n=1 Tax=Gimesia algae TaxID=2527971 RepID=A0A517VKV7_9PLAN|nr:multiheme c-type cytochrome [Gimesia algae]QDT93654.1 Perchlorate reductase subunit gamma precursor [Gimesia algae]